MARNRAHAEADHKDNSPQAQIHVGVVASGDLILQSSIDRERIQKETGAVAFEMEGAGVWDETPCIVLKAVCDYADSHKHKGWQNYAAATAAAASKAVLERYILTDKAGTERKVEGTLATGGSQRKSSPARGAVSQAPISGHNVIAGPTVTGGTTTFNFQS